MNPAALVEAIGTLLYLIILARILLSWFPNVSQENTVVSFIYFMSEPILGPIRRMLPTTSVFDFAPMLAIILIFIIQEILLRVLS